MTVSIIIPCRNEARVIEAVLQSVADQQPPPGGFEILVADGMSDDGTREILLRVGQKSLGPGAVASSPPMRVIDNASRMAATGLNAAIRVASGDIIIRMDAHTEYAPDYVRQCVAVLEQTKADNVGGPARTKANTYMAQAIAAAYHSPFSVGGARFHNVDYEGYVDTVTYGCWRREAFDRFGLFDEELARNQDDEHNLRIIRNGGKVWQSPKIKSWYRPRGSLSSLFKQYRQYGYWKVRVIQKHRLPAAWRHLVPGTFVLTLLGLLLVLALCYLLSGILEGAHALMIFHPVVLALAFLGRFSAFSLVLTCSAYFVAVLAASVVTACRAGWKLLPVLPSVFACYHLGYGSGFLRGVWDFIIWRKGSAAPLQALTR